jgi:hypothetical protein
MRVSYTGSQDARRAKDPLALLSHRLHLSQANHRDERLRCNVHPFSPHGPSYLHASRAIVVGEAERVALSADRYFADQRKSTNKFA